MTTKLTKEEFSFEQMIEFIQRTHKIGELTNVTYTDIVRVYGEPSILHYENDKTDGKIQVEWIFQYDSKPFTIYDWKTYDLESTMESLKTWSIGGLSEDEEFINSLKNSLGGK